MLLLRSLFKLKKKILKIFFSSISLVPVSVLVTTGLLLCAQHHWFAIGFLNCQSSTHHPIQTPEPIRASPAICSVGVWGGGSFTCKHSGISNAWLSSLLLLRLFWWEERAPHKFKRKIKWLLIEYFENSLFPTSSQVASEFSVVIFSLARLIMFSRKTLKP